MDKQLGQETRQSQLVGNDMAVSVRGCTIEGAASKRLGRPPIYTKELGESICARIAAGESLRAITRDDDMPNRSTVNDWLLDEKYKDFSDHYTRACDIRAESMFEELLEIADDGSNDWMLIQKKNGYVIEVPDKEVIMRSRLRVDTRKWFLSKVMPKKYGDKLDLTSKGEKLPSGNTIVFANFEEHETDSEREL